MASEIHNEINNRAVDGTEAVNVAHQAMMADVMQGQMMTQDRKCGGASSSETLPSMTFYDGSKESKTFLPVPQANEIPGAEYQNNHLEAMKLPQGYNGVSLEQLGKISKEQDEQLRKNDPEGWKEQHKWDGMLKSDNRGLENQMTPPDSTGGGPVDSGAPSESFLPYDQGVRLYEKMYGHKSTAHYDPRNDY